MPGDPLYRGVVRVAREPRWYLAGQVADSIDGRFDMVVLVLSLTLLRLEREGEPMQQMVVDVTERFIADMDGSLREIGIGDLVVGKHVGRLVGALEGRLGAYREAFAPDADPALLTSALTRNLYRGQLPSAEALDWTATQARALARRVDELPLDQLLAGDIEDIQ